MNGFALAYLAKNRVNERVNQLVHAGIREMNDEIESTTPHESVEELHLWKCPCHRCVGLRAPTTAGDAAIDEFGRHFWRSITLDYYNVAADLERGGVWFTGIGERYRSASLNIKDLVVK